MMILLIFRSVFNIMSIIPILNKKCKDIWKRDNDRLSYLKSIGNEILVIWECDYKKNKDDVINKCKEFLR